MIPTRFEHAIETWFRSTYGAPTPIQQRAWPLLGAGRDALLMASTGQGKTLAAWRPLIERFLEQPARRRGVRALHIAPLKSLARDMTHNLAPLMQLAELLHDAPFRIELRCGDTLAVQRAAQRRHPPALLATTPESLFVLLGSSTGRAMLRTVEALVLDELHVLAAGKRGAHLALSLVRLEELCARPLQRIGLSATAGAPRALADWLSGAQCEIVTVPAARAPRVRIELPASGLSAVPALRLRDAAWDRIATLAAGSASMLLFCQTRGEVERSAAALEQRLTACGRPGQVGAHHGSLDRIHRERIEERFRAGRLRLLVSSASLELGLDLGRVERVAQFGVPGSAALLCQRAGRSNHRPDGRALIHLFPLTLSQLIEAEALRECVERSRHELPDVAGNPAAGAAEAPLDVLTQQLLALIDGGVQDIEALHCRVTRAWPYRHISRDCIERVIEAACSTPERMPQAQVSGLLRRQNDGSLRTAVQAGRLLALNAGVIPEYFEYEVRRLDNGERVGRLDEEFAFESSPGELVQLGHRSWRIVRVRPGEVLVEPDPAAATQLPFWFGDGAGRSALVAAAVRRRIAALDVHPEARRMLEESRTRLGALPGPGRIVIERFPDPAGDRHIVIHSFAGARVNRAWGLALRKRFCRQFNFELQAAATDDGVLISLGVTSEFEVEQIVRFVCAAQVEDVLTQALLDTPLFVTRFRWCASNALQVLRRDASGSISAQCQRNTTENLIACVFPDQLACLENLAGPRQIPDHPLVEQALRDCLHQHMDLAGLIELLQDIESGRIEVHAVDLEQPSPLAAGLLQAPRHSFLDPAAAEERRTRAFELRPRSRPLQSTGCTVPAPCSSGRVPRSGVSAGPDALEHLLQRSGYLTAAEGERGLGLARPIPVGGWTRSFSILVRERRALAARLGPQYPWLWLGIGLAATLRQRLPALELRPWLDPQQLEIVAGQGAVSFDAVARGRAGLQQADDAGVWAAIMAAIMAATKATAGSDSVA